MQHQIKYIIVFFLGSISVLAQERDKDTIDTQVVNVIKPYTPTISDAFKVKEVPTVNQDTTLKKRPVRYNIFSIPVASTFTPAKGKAADVEKEEPIKLFDNYASLGVGTYTTILGEVYLNHAINRTERVGGYFSHHSSAGGIENLLLDDNFSLTQLNANYSRKLRDYSWKVDLGFSRQVANWYGLPPVSFNQTTASMIDPEQVYSSFYAGGKLNFQDGIIKSGKVKFRRFYDSDDSGENRFIANTVLNIPIQGETINTEINVDYIGGNFNRTFNSNTELNYGNINVGLAPSYQLTQDDLTVNLGINMVYLNDTEASKNKFFIYPNITASYRLVNDLLIAFAGIEGGLIQNSYHDFVQTNPFVSPTLIVAPTDQRYNTSLGIKGKLSNAVSYKVSGHYIADEAKPLFRANSVLTGATEDYQYGNSFQVVYDDVKTFSIAGELNVDVNRNFTLGLKGEYFGYNTDTQAEAWNLPDIKGSAFIDVQIDRHWFAGASVFYVGERKDLYSELGSLTMPIDTVITLDSFIDANAHLGYRINDQFSAFVKGNNLFNQDAPRWQNFPVQGIQFLAGLTYQFDF
ncbi:TonB-dependent receptor [Ichthyenterobacterium sp. W332]|uniref:TonB-dependent receptor n=1 Tax=Microcosmobacter mediterraneus TaxID=3075607 RepID=A0ABU2YM44_9FLAO|nr:TonB-dependent receptor [Ichthyenterobacterium sp. W332]MDT0559234.1 TonB-dependent receptor [Ichthyenterobacterium sp. W332]